MLDQLTYNLQQHLKEGQVKDQAQDPPKFIMRLQNINWLDWKNYYTSYVVFIRPSQNNRRHNVLVNSNFMTDVVVNNFEAHFQSV